MISRVCFLLLGEGSTPDIRVHAASAASPGPEQLVLSAVGAGVSVWTPGQAARGRSVFILAIASVNRRTDVWHSTAPGPGTTGAFSWAMLVVTQWHRKCART